MIANRPIAYRDTHSTYKAFLVLFCQSNEIIFTRIKKQRFDRKFFLTQQFCYYFSRSKQTTFSQPLTGATVSRDLGIFLWMYVGRASFWDPPLIFLRFLCWVVIELFNSKDPMRLMQKTYLFPMQIGMPHAISQFRQLLVTRVKNCCRLT